MNDLGDLNDLRFVSAIAGAATLAGAARRLGVNHATAFRRLEALEARLKVRLFERVAGRYTPTPEGEALARAGSALEDTAAEALRQVAGRDLRPSGLVRVTTTDTIAQLLLPAMFAELRASCPEISLQLHATNELHNLSKHDADIAVRPASQPPGHLLGRRVGRMAYAVYAERRAWSAWCGAAATAPAWRLAPWIAIDDSLSQHRSLAWLARQLPLAEVALRCSSFMAVAQACAGGLGLAVLPCFVGAALAPLQRVSAPLAELETDAWLLSHADLRGSARVRVVLDALQRGFGRVETRLAGV